MQTTLQQQLATTQRQHLLYLLFVLLNRSYKRALRLMGLTMKIAELTTRNADIRNIHIAVYLPRHDTLIRHCRLA
jgi:hypothetical protein